MLSDINDIDQNDSVEYGLRTDVLDLIQDQIKVAVGIDTSASLFELVYEIVVTVLRSPNIRRSDGSMVDDIIVYYLESYKTFKANIHPSEDNDKFFNEASLYIFDLYINDINNQTKRKMLESIAHSIRDFHVDRLSKKVDPSDKNMFLIINNITIISHTISYYLSRPRRSENIAYIKWVKNIFFQLFETEDYSFVVESQDIKNVTEQILNKNKRINIVSN